jgi:transcriptional regulator with XRE-family HTH domain
MSMGATGGSRTNPELTRAHVALSELFAALDAEDWHVVVSHLDDDVELADELTGTWLRGRDAVARYLRAQEGIVTDIVSRPVDVSARRLVGDTWLTTFNFEQRYLLMGEKHRERLTGLCVLHISADSWRLGVYHLGGSARDAVGLSEGDDVSAGPLPHPAGEPPVTGELIRRRRQELGLSLRAVAERAGLSASLLSQVERGRTDPSVGSLRHIASALDLAVHQLAGEVAAPGSEVLLARSRDRHLVNLGFQGIAVESFPSRATPALSAYVRRYSGVDRSRGGVDAPSDALLYVLEGAVELTSGGVTSVLASNDAAMVGASTSYELRPLPGRTTRVLVVQARLARHSDHATD